MTTYRHLVEVQDKRYPSRLLTPSDPARFYDGPDAAEAMAAWSRAITDGVEYVTLESLAVRSP